MNTTAIVFSSLSGATTNAGLTTQVLKQCQRRAVATGRRPRRRAAASGPAAVPAAAASVACLQRTLAAAMCRCCAGARCRCTCRQSLPSQHAWSCKESFLWLFAACLLFITAHAAHFQAHGHDMCSCRAGKLRSSLLRPWRPVTRRTPRCCSRTTSWAQRCSSSTFRLGFN